MIAEEDHAYGNQGREGKHDAAHELRLVGEFPVQAKGYEGGEDRAGGEGCEVTEESYFIAVGFPIGAFVEAEVQIVREAVIVAVPADPRAQWQKQQGKRQAFGAFQTERDVGSQCLQCKGSS